MSANQAHRVLRNFRHMGPTQFYIFNQRVRTSLSDKTRFPDSMWGGNISLIESYFAAAEKHDGVYHESMLGSKLVIAEREVLQAQLVNYLEEIASLLEMAAVRTPDILIASGFDLTKERRSPTRAKATSTANSQQAEKGDGESGV